VPSIPVVHNVDAAVSSDADGIRRRLTAQLSEPVRWSTCVARLTERGVAKIAECGPGNVLAGLIKRIDKNVEVSGLGDAASFDTTLAVGNT
jgi:[acyl-carrier-protein] S-malonyltransferase